MAKTDTTERLKKAIAALDKAVQAWYKEHDPENTQRYATVHIRTYPYTKHHASNATLCCTNGKYIDFISPLQLMQVLMFDCNCDYCKELEELKEENKKLNVLFADIIEAFTSRSYNDDFEMAQAGKEIYELFYGGKDPKEVFHNAEVPKCSRQLLAEAEIAKELKNV